MMGPREAAAFWRTLTSGTPFIKWTLSPVLLVTGLALPFLVDPARTETVAGFWALFLMEVACAALFAGFWLPARYARWAYRVVGLIVVIAFLATAFDGVGSGKTSLRTAIVFISFIGIPFLIYAALGYRIRKLQEKSVEPRVRDREIDQG